LYKETKKKARYAMTDNTGNIPGCLTHGVQFESQVAVTWHQPKISSSKFHPYFLTNMTQTGWTLPPASHLYTASYLNQCTYREYKEYSIGKQCK
jgi:hypothetical protein